MASINKAGQRYLVRWRDPDGRQRKRSAPDRETARALQREIEQDRALGRRWAPRDAQAVPELRHLFQRFVEARSRTRSMNTLKSYDVSLMAYLGFLRRRYPQTGALRLDLLSMTNVEAFDAWLRNTGRAARTAEKRVRDIMQAWRWAYDSETWGDIVARPRAMEFPPVMVTPVVAPTWAQMDAAIAATTDWARDIFVIMRCTGLRRAQAMALTWADVDMMGAMLTVRGELGKSRQEKQGRRIPISRHLVEHLAGLGRREGYLVAPHKAQRKMYSDKAKQIWERSGMPAEVWRGQPNHAFRKGFESGLIALGANYHAVEYLVGHAMAGAGSSYVDTRWALRVRDAVELVPGLARSHADQRLNLIVNGVPQVAGSRSDEP